MTFVGHAVLFFIAGFTQYLLMVQRGHPLGIFLVIALPVVGMYILGWWALLTFVVGLMVGSRVFFESAKSAQKPPEE